MGFPDLTLLNLLSLGLPAVAQTLSCLVRSDPLARQGEVLRNLPSVFKPTHRNCRAIIDCTELFCKRARNLTLRALLVKLQAPQYT